MLKKYDKFIKEFQKDIDKYFEENSEYIYCHDGCSACCEVGEYPFSWIEMGYLMEAFVKLPENIKQQIKVNIQNLKIQKQNFTLVRTDDCNKRRNLTIILEKHGILI